MTAWHRLDPLRPGRRARAAMPSNARLVDQRADQRVRLARIADLHAREQLAQARDQRVGDRCRGRSAGAATCSAARRSRPPRTGSPARPAPGRRDGATIIALLPPSSSSERPKRCATRGPTARPIAVDPVADTKRDARIVDQRLADLAAALDQLQQPVRRIAEPLQRPSRQRHHRRGGQRRLLARLPDHRIAADQRQRRVPRPHRDREIEGADHQHRRPADAIARSSGGRAARWRWSGRRAGATGRPRSRRCRSSPGPRRGLPGRSCRLPA